MSNVPIANTVADHWLNNILNQEMRSDSLTQILSQVFSIRLDRELWTFACDGRVAVSIKENIGAPEFEGSQKITEVLRTPDAEPFVESWESLREWAGPPEFVTQVACKECYGEGKCECEKCGHFGNCPDCEGSGKTWKRPEHRYAMLAGKPIDSLLLSRGLSGGQAGPCKVYVRNTDGDGAMFQIRDDRCIVAVAALGSDRDILAECSQRKSYEDWKANR